MAERRFVIVCLANGQNYIDWIKDFNYSAKEIGCTVIGFNYRGIDYSQGLIWTENNMVEDVLAQVNYLLSLGAKPEHIGLEGMCVGGAVATLAAAQAHDNNLPVKLYNERSFRSIARVLAGTFLSEALEPNFWNPLTSLRYLAAALRANASKRIINNQYAYVPRFMRGIQITILMKSVWILRIKRRT